MFVFPSVLLIKRLLHYCSVSFFITDQPEFFEHPKNETKTEGDNVTFTCNATGNPAPTFRWTKIGSVLTTGSRISLSLDGKQLFVTNVIREDSGRYVCEATNNVTTVPSNFATLNVQCKITYYNYFLIERRSMTSRHHGSTISGWQQYQPRRRRKENGKQVKGFYGQKNKFARESCYFVHFFAVLAPLQHETS